MARDGTARGSNIKVNAGRKSKALAEKMEAGNPGGRKLKIIDLPDGAELEGKISQSQVLILSPSRKLWESSMQNIFTDTFICT